MNIEPLETWLDNWTNYRRVISDSWRDENCNELEFNFNIPYLHNNTLPNWHIYNLYTYILELRFKNCRNIIYPDEEAEKVSMSENLVHPVCAYEDCKMKIQTEDFCGYDFEMAELISTERLIHPVLLSQHLKQEIIIMEKELTILTVKRLDDTVENLELIHI